jgi:hypothetical protein
MRFNGQRNGRTAKRAGRIDRLNDLGPAPKD